MSILAMGLGGGCSLDPVATDLTACVTGQPCASVGGAGGSVVASGGGGPLGSGGIATGTGGAAGGSPPTSGGAGNTSGGATGTGGIVGGSGGAGEPCTDIPPPDDLHDWDGATCQMWTTEAASDPCVEEWFNGYCNESCGRCESTGAGGSGSGGGGNTGGGSNGSGGGLGDDNPWGNVSGGQNGWASRYWDCCKQSCAWAENAGGNPVDSCGGDGSNVIGNNEASACPSGSATTCNSFAPWAYSNKVSFGFAATHAGSGTPCGTCYQLQFTGSGHSGNDPGSQALNGKVMIVMAANIGGDVSADGQLDLLIPGGGIGAANGTGGLGYGCDTVWGISSPDDPVLGADYGGLRAGCGGDLNSVKTCMNQKCEALFGSRGLDELYEGCLWYTNWFEAADNPNFTYKQIDCPQELVSVSGR